MAIKNNLSIFTKEIPETYILLIPETYISEYAIILQI